MFLQQNYAWSSDNMSDDDTTIYAYNTWSSAENNYVYSGVLWDFKGYVQNTFSTSIAYDHALAVTG